MKTTERNDMTETETAEAETTETVSKETANGANPDVHPQNANSQGAESGDAPRAKKSKLTGAYWFVDKSAEELSKQSFIRNMLTVIALLLQFVVLLLPQNGIGYITENLPSYAFIYMCAVFVMIGVALYVIIMNFRRYRLMKRIPKEYAPRGGFKYRSFFGAEAFVAVTAIMLIMEISFVCLSYDGFGLLGVFITALSVAAAVWARMIPVLTLKDAIYVPAIGEETEKQETADTAEASEKAETDDKK